MFNTDVRPIKAFGVGDATIKACGPDLAKDGVKDRDRRPIGRSGTYRSLKDIMMEEASKPFLGSSLAGRIVIARPEIHVSEFTSTMTLLLEHGSEGALGVVINRPSGIQLADAFPDWEDMGGTPGVVFAGGPVDTDAIIALGKPEQAAGDLVLGAHPIDLDDQPALVAGQGISQIRIFAGYAGWGAGQLEGEIANNGWWVVDATIEDLFSEDPQNLWARTLRRSGGELAWYAHYPLDPSLN